MLLLNHTDIAWLKVQFHPHRLKRVATVGTIPALIAALILGIQDPISFNWHAPRGIWIMFAISFLTAWGWPWILEEYNRTLPLSRFRTAALTLLTQSLWPLSATGLGLLMTIPNATFPGWNMWLVWRDVSLGAFSAAILLLYASAHLRGEKSEQRQRLLQYLSTCQLFVIIAMSRIEYEIYFTLALLSVFLISALRESGPPRKCKAKAPRKTCPKDLCEFRSITFASHQRRILIPLCIMAFFIWIFLPLARGIRIDFSPLASLMLTCIACIGAFWMAPGALLFGFHPGEQGSCDPMSFVRTLPIDRPRMLRRHIERGLTHCLPVLGLALFVYLVGQWFADPSATRLWIKGLWILHSSIAFSCLAIFMGARFNSRGEREVEDLAWALLLLVPVGASALLAYLIAHLWGVAACMTAWAVFAWQFIPEIDWQREV